MHEETTWKGVLGGEMAASDLARRAASFLTTAFLMAAALAMVISAALLEPRVNELFGRRIGGFIASDDNRTLALGRVWRQTVWSFGLPLPGTPELEDLNGRLEKSGLKVGAPVFIRIFKRDFVLEVWLQKNERFELFASYPICQFSGRLGPKFLQGDRQSPEGIYTVSTEQLNPNSRWYRSFNLGFPNSFDRSHGRTGSYLMVHGGCSSIGCYAMTNAVISEIWTLVTAALNGGQKRFQVQALPFRMTDSNLSARQDHPSHALWQQLKVAYDLFEETHIPPQVDVCDKGYVAAAGAAGSDGSDELQLSCRHAQSLATN
jgi:murein L,D-transpeptidase YafK